ncbi:hypothetical protein H0H93_010502 [Arthromyces matolae]|nr:hypothetical protein H0H93_010502 [Arthromyces matolae]
MRILDIISVCLTSGEPGDVVAAAFEKSERVQLILAKTGEVVEEDHTRVRQFIETLLSANDWTNVLRFLMTHSKANLEKRIQNLHQTISDLYEELLVAATKYTFDESISVEFPKSDTNVFMSILSPEARNNPRRILEDLLRLCKDRSADFEIQHKRSSFRRIVEIIIVANALRKSAFFTVLMAKNRNLTQLEFQERVEKLQRRLGKVGQYTRIHNLIKMVKRLQGIPFFWVQDQLVDAGEGSYENSLTPEDAIQCALQQQVSGIGLQDFDMDAVYKQYPNLRPTWAQHRIINPRVHAELRIILHLTRSLSSSSSAELPTYPPTQYPIGCSKRSCICCHLWMSAFNQSTNMSWMTSGCHGKPYENWALPGPAGSMQNGALLGPASRMQEAMVVKVNRLVVNAINMRLVDTLDWARIENTKFRRVSDEHASSGSDTDGSQEITMRILERKEEGPFSK